MTKELCFNKVLVHLSIDTVAWWTAKWDVRGSNPDQGRDLCSRRSSIPPLGSQISEYQSQSLACNSPRVRKGGSREWVQILGSQTKKTRKKCNDTGKKRRPENTSTWVKRRRKKSLDPVSSQGAREGFSLQKKNIASQKLPQLSLEFLHIFFFFLNR